MAPKQHPAPMSGGDRKALKKELSKSRAMTHIFAERSAEKRREGEALIREADNLTCQSWNERMWSDGGPIDPSPTIDQAINGGLMRALLMLTFEPRTSDLEKMYKNSNEIENSYQLPWRYTGPQTRARGSHADNEEGRSHLRQSRARSL